MTAKTKTSVKEKETKNVKAPVKKQPLSPEDVLHRLHDDVRTSVLIVSIAVNLFFLIGWLVIQVSTRYDAALINYLQNR